MRWGNSAQQNQKSALDGSSGMAHSRALNRRFDGTPWTTESGSVSRFSQFEFQTAPQLVLPGVLIVLAVGKQNGGHTKTGFRSGSSRHNEDSDIEAIALSGEI